MKENGMEYEITQDTETNEKEKKPLPYYVITTPIKVDSESDGDTSSGEEMQTFSEDYFENPEEHFRLFPKEKKTKNGNETSKKQYRGKIIADLIEPIPTVIFNEYSIKKQQHLVDQFTKESFGKNAEESATIAKDRLALSFGLNKMRSLSDSRNKSLENAVDASLESPLPIKKFGFFWEGVWQERESEHHKWGPVSYNRVKSFYRQLKKHDLDKAKQFRHHVESSRKHLVPFRENRDEIKNHKNTKSLIRTHRENGSEQDVYIGIFDDDSQSLRSKDIGLFSAYDELYSQANVKPTVASTGYIIQEPNNPLLELGVLCDKSVRHSTAQFIKNGVYYPEPNCIVKVESDKETVVENFSTVKEPNYKSPMEMPHLIERILKNRKLNPQNALLFNANHPLVTATFDHKNFTAVRNKKNKIVLWTLADFQAMRGIRQSHFNSMKWAQNVLTAFATTLAREIRIDDFDIIITKKNTMRNIAISLMSRLFNSFDPIHIAESKCKSQPGVSFQKCLIEVLNNYEHLNFSVAKATRNYEKKHNSKHNQSNNNVAYAWSYYDEINTISGLKAELNKIFSGANRLAMNAAAIEAAAKASHKAIVEILKENLCLEFEKLSQSLLIDLFKKNGTKVKKNKAIKLADIYQMILDNTILQKKTEAIKLMKNLKDSALSIYGTTPLHWAAITGNKELIVWLKDKAKQFDWLSDIGIAADNDILPIHCAIKYCVSNGNDLELLELLIDRETIIYETSNGKTPLSMAVAELDDPLPVVNFLLEKYKTYLLAEGEELGFDEIDMIDSDVVITAIKRGRFQVAKLLSQYCATEDAIGEMICDMAPQVSYNLIRFVKAEGMEGFIEYAMEQLHPEERLLFRLNLGYPLDELVSSSSEDEFYISSEEAPSPSKRQHEETDLVENKKQKIAATNATLIKQFGLVSNFSTQQSDHQSDSDKNVQDEEKDSSSKVQSYCS